MIHEDTKIQDIKTFKCFLCTKSFPSKSQLVGHLKIHKGKKDVTCSLCSASFISQSYLNVHMKKHKEGRYTCKICNHTCNSQQNLKTHLKIHDEGKIEFECFKCSRSFSDVKSLRRHTAKHHPRKSISCPICKKTFQGIASFKNHFRQYHGINERGPHKRLKVTCVLCQRNFSSVHKVKSHITAVHTESVTCQPIVEQYKESSELGLAGQGRTRHVTHVVNMAKLITLQKIIKIYSVIIGW